MLLFSKSITSMKLKLRLAYFEKTCTISFVNCRALPASRSTAAETRATSSVCSRMELFSASTFTFLAMITYLDFLKTSLSIVQKVHLYSLHFLMKFHNVDLFLKILPILSIIGLKSQTRFGERVFWLKNLVKIQESRNLFLNHSNLFFADWRIRWSLARSRR